jgi:hypothetical protein
MTTIIPQHTKNRVISIQWKDQNGDAKSLTGSTGITGVLRTGKEPSETDVPIVGAIAITNAALGLTEWTLDEADTDGVGIHGAYFFAAFAGSQILPSLRHNIEFVSTPTPPA